MCVRYYYVLFNIFLQNLLNVLYVVLVALNTYSSVGTGFWGRLVGTAARELTSMWIDTIMHEIGDQFAISDGLMSLQSLQLSPSEHAFFHLRGGLQCSRRYFFFEGLRKSTNATINKLQLKNCLLSRISTWCTQQQNFYPTVSWLELINFILNTELKCLVYFFSGLCNHCQLNAETNDHSLPFTFKLSVSCVQKTKTLNNLLWIISPCYSYTCNI